MAASARIVTVTQTANVVNMIVQKKTQEGIDRSRLRVTARATETSAPASSAGEGSENARTAGLCVARRESVQNGFADIIRLTSGFFLYSCLFTARSDGRDSDFQSVSLWPVRLAC